MAYNVDLQKIADGLEFDVEDVEMLIEVFLQSAEESLQSLREAIDSSNLEQIFKSAHAIKGSAANLTLTDISVLAKEIELEARAGNKIDYIERFILLKSMIDKI